MRPLAPKGDCHIAERIQQWPTGTSYVHTLCGADFDDYGAPSRWPTLLMTTRLKAAFDAVSCGRCKVLRDQWLEESDVHP